MKKIYLSSLSIIAALTVNAQAITFELTDDENANAIVANNQLFNHSVAPLALSQHHFTLKNISATTQTINIRKYEDLLNTVSGSDMAEAVFCTGTTCYPNNVFNASVVIAPSQTIAFIADLTEATVIGESNIRYRLINADNSSDIMYVLFKYNAPVGLTKQSAIFSNVSSVFPNPSNAGAFINVNTVKNIQTQVTIVNALGSVVNTTEIELIKGKNVVKLNTEELNPGVYFVSLINANTVITRKITITK